MSCKELISFEDFVRAIDEWKLFPLSILDLVCSYVAQFRYPALFIARAYDTSKVHAQFATQGALWHKERGMAVYEMKQLDEIECTSFLQYHELPSMLSLKIIGSFGFARETQTPGWLRNDVYDFVLGNKDNALYIQGEIENRKFAEKFGLL